MFTSPIGLLALLGVPAVVLLHLFRRRFRPQQVSALFLWLPRDRTPLSGRKREPLRTSASFWLEILAALLGGLAFAGPRGCSEASSQHLVCVLDDSASMSARTSQGSIRDRAIALVEERIAGLPTNARVTLILSGVPPRVLAGPSAFPAEALARLAQYVPNTPGHSLLPGLALGERVAGDGTVWLLTDRHEPDTLPNNVELDAIGAPTSNLAIVSASRIPIEQADPAQAKERALLTIQNLSTQTTSSSVEFTSQERVVGRREFELEPGERTNLAFDLPHSGVFQASLPDDALALDNVATFAPRPPRTIALYSNLDSETAQRLGLASNADGSQLDALLRLVPASVQAPNASAAHLLLSSSLSAPAGSSTTWCLTLDAGPTEERQDLIGPFLIERKHPVFRGVTLDGIIWSRNPTQAPPGSPLVSAGNEPLFCEQVLPTRRLFFANFDSERSSLQRSPDWPILLANLVEMRRAELPGARSTNIASGEEFIWLGAGEAEYVVEGVNVRIERTALGTLVLSEALAPGLYTLSSDGTPLCQFGVSFADAVESDLRELSSGELRRDANLATVDSATPFVQLLLLAGMLLFLLADWYVLGRDSGSALKGAKP